MTQPSLYLLGPPRIESGGSPLEVDTRKAVALLAYLTITRRRESRDSLVGLLWPDHGQKRARAALRRTLSSLARAREEGWLQIERDTVGLDHERVWVDVDRFRELLAQPASHGHPESEVCPACLPALTEAASLYRDDFLAGFGLRDSFAFDDWQYFQAEELRRELAGALEKLARGHGAAGEWEAAITHARRRLLLDPLHEPAHRALMQLYALSGERASALRQYRECIRILEKELGVAPLEETTLLYRAVQEGTTVPPLAAATTSGVASDITTGAMPEIAHDAAATGVPLIGRAAGWAALEEAYAHAPDGAFVLVEGEAGIGKTRLAEEFLAGAGGRGAPVLTTRCYEGEMDLAYGPFIEVLRAATERPELAGRLEHAPPGTLAEAARLLPAFAAMLPEVPSLPPLDTPGARSRFFEGTVQTLFTALADGTRDAPPGILFMDDLQWADEASLDLLSYLARRLRGRPLMVLAAWREELVPEDHRLRSLVSEMRDRTTVVKLSPLDEAAVREMASRSGVSPELGERLYRETEGLPLFLIEYLAAISRGDLTSDGEAWSLPGGVQSLLHGRLRETGETGGQLLAAAAAIGRSFDFDTLREASGRGEEETVTALEGLISHRLIREVSNESGNEDPLYDFSHDKLRSLAYEETSLARRRLLHRRVAETLAARARRRDGGASEAQIAHHYRLAGRDEAAAEHYLAAGEHARSLSAHAEALSHFETALALGHPDTARLHESIGDVHTLRGEYGAATASYETAAAGAAGISLNEIERKLGGVHARRGEWELAEGHYRTALEGLGDRDHAEERAHLYADLALLRRHQDRAAEAEEFVDLALELAADDPHALARAHNAAGMLARGRGDWDSALEHLERSLELAERLGEPDARVAALNNLALACGAAGDTDRAIQEAEAALALCIASGDLHREAALRNNLADLFHAAGLTEESMSQLKRAVEIFADLGEEEASQPGIWMLTEW